MKLLSLSASVAVLMLASRAEAQITKIPIPGITTGTTMVDFATCEKDLPACSETRTDCCYRSFDAGSIVVPMDRCHQAFDGKDLGPVTNASTPVFCADPNSTMDSRDKDGGLLDAYGLVYRLMQAGVPIYWLSNPTKDPQTNTDTAPDTYTSRDIDFWIMTPGTATAPPTAGSLTACGAGCVDPVKLLNKTTLAAIADTYNRKEFPVRGGFVIAKEDRTKFDAFWKKQSPYNVAPYTTYDFSLVDLYEIQASGATPARLAYQDYRPSPVILGGGSTTLPVAQKIDYRAPRLARQGPSATSTHYLAEASLDVAAPYPSCLNPDYVWPANAVYCELTDADITTGKLVSGKFDWAWVNKVNSYDAAIATAIQTFVTKTATRPGGSVAFEGNSAEAHHLFIMTTGMDAGGTSIKEKLIVRYPGNLLSQTGDFFLDFKSGGGMGYWNYFGAGATGYKSAAAGTAVPPAAGTLVRLFTQEAASSVTNPQCTGHKSTETCDVFANNAAADVIDSCVYWRYNNVADNGLLFYMSGNNPASNYSQLRVLLNSLIALPAGTTMQTLTESKQIARSSPVLASIGSGALASHQGIMLATNPTPSPTVYSGSASNATYEFPQVTGHIYAMSVSSLTNGSVTSYASGTALESFPTVTASGCGGAAFSGTCRTVFTNTATGKTPAIVHISTANRSTLKPLIASGFSDTDTDTLIGRILAGGASGGSYVAKLGGVDRSTMAIVEPSPNAGGGRPTMIYVGALDGMLHAICGEAKSGTGCTVAGRELWAYVPRTQLSRLRQNTARIDGSPKVADVLVSGAWKTVLVFQTGSGDPAVPADAPAAIALDITNPSSPSILWERTPPASRGSTEQGVGLGIAVGTISTTTYAFFQTTNGGTGGAGTVVMAVNLATGDTGTGVVNAPTWKYARLYPAPRTTGSSPVSATAIPGGVTLADPAHEGQVTRVLVPSIYGDVVMLDAANGTNVHGTKALFQFESDYHPIGAPVSLYRTDAQGTLYAVVASGGYADPVSTAWSPTGTTQYAIAFALDTPTATAPITDTGSFSPAFRPWNYTLGVGARAFGQAVIAGGELFIATDTVDANASDFGFGSTTSATLHRVSLAGNLIGTTSLPGSASGVDVATDGKVIAGAGAGAKRIDSTSFSSQGVGIEISVPEEMKRRLWISN